MKSIKHDIWKDNEGLTSLILSGDFGEEGRSLLENGSQIIHSFYADSHFDAMTKYYDFMDWGKYETEFEVDKKPYDLFELKVMIDRNKTIEQIEGKKLGIPQNESRLVTTFHELRTKKIQDLTIEDLRLLIGQNLCLDVLIPKAILKLKTDILCEGDLYEGDLLKSVLESEKDYWIKNKETWTAVVKLCQDNEAIFRSDNVFQQIVKSIKEFSEINAR
jgi:hypothetical protein